MDSNLFIEYLNRLDRKYFLEQQKCVFFIDNCRAHPPIEHLNHLHAIQEIDANTVYDFKSVAYDAVDASKKQSLITDYLIKN